MGGPLAGCRPTLDVIHQQFSRLFRIALSEILRTDSRHRHQPVGLKFGNLRNAWVPAYLQIIVQEPLRAAMIATDAATVYMLVDHFLEAPVKRTSNLRDRILR